MDDNELKITRVIYPEDYEFIRVVFKSSGAVDVRLPLVPRGGTEVEGEPLDTSALEIARLMNFAYRLGRANYVERLKAKGADVVLEDTLDAEYIEEP